MKWFTKQKLLEALKKEGLPATYKFLLKMERAGIVPTSNSAIEVSVSNRMRLYSEKEILEIVDKVKVYKKR